MLFALWTFGKQKVEKNASTALDVWLEACAIIAHQCGMRTISLFCDVSAI